MSKETNDNGDDSSFQAFIYRQSAQISTIALEMVIPAVIGVGLDRLFGTVVLFAILGMILGVALGFWRLVKIAQSQNQTGGGNGVDKSPDTGDNGTGSTI